MSTYTSKDIKVLDEITHIRINPSMYIGNTETPTHLVEEALDNALDECQNGYANIVAIEIDTKTHRCSVYDNGRGIPCDNDVPITISTKLHSGSKFRGMKEAYNTSCLRGDTKIMLLNGEDKTIKEMAENPDLDYYGLASTTDGKWKAVKLLYPRITKTVTSLVRLHIDNGTYVDCTEDHLFLLKNGTYKMAKDLQTSDSLMPCYTTEINGYNCIRQNNTYDYIRNIKFENRKSIPLHKIVYETFVGEISIEDANIHHIDMNRKNNYPNNLSLLTDKEHLREHVRINMLNGTIYTESLIKYNKSEKGRKKSSEIGKKMVNILKEYCNSDKHKKDKSELMQKLNSDNEFQKNARISKVLKYGRTLLLHELELNKDNWDKYLPYNIVSFDRAIRTFGSLSNFIKECNEYTKSYESLEVYKIPYIIGSRLINICDRITSNNLEINENNYTLYREKYDPTYEAILKYFESIENIIEYYNKRNHKVINIEYITLDTPEYVYDLTVPEYENFVLSNGIISHNCGIHGIGLVAVNILSTEYSIEVYRKDDKDKTRHWLFNFFNGVFDKQSSILNKIEKDKFPFSTCVSFIPDSDIFESLDYNIDRIRKRLLIAANELPDAKAILSIDGKKEIFLNDKEKFFKENCLSSSDESISPIIYSSIENSNEKMSLMFCYAYNSTSTPKFTSSINILPVSGGGTHIGAVSEIIKDVIHPRCKKIDSRIDQADCLNGIRCYISMAVRDVEFGGQSKDKFVVKKEKYSNLLNDIKKQLGKYLDQTPEIVSEIAAYFIESKNLQAAKKIGVKAGKRYSTKFTKLRDCTRLNGELFICEGDSAAAGIIEKRNSDIHAVLPLKGKIPSVVGTKEILKNVEINEIIEAIGTGIGPMFNISNIRYSKIICATDADADGGHISSLMMMAIASLVPDVIKNGYFYLARTPLYAISSGKTFIPLWDDESLETARKQKKPIIRLKGLGELSPWQLKICLLDEETRKLEQVKFTTNLDKHIKLFSDSDEKRKLLEGDWNV